ncbi:aminotransferase V [Niastella yeongjuensis]|uniref:Aminotransferase V n=1 Tax=Niastella yeongjuensis TaxID=354355 RepID=A0A1V9F7H7_9BACT|nr:aminotransferase class V-fold PLP-dependent enzyme [Niastella yeongjuensis]OQP54232.1 aminotransferase V [Niastella yeongjuensis]SEP31561.1 Selenocysteine lyase/Cysteine desulfurase [Niastella yeongjuensis]
MRTFNRRSFLQSVRSLTAGTALATLTQPAWSRHLNQALATASNKSPGELASDEDFWHYIQQSYTVSPSIINLNNGGVAPSPIPVQEAMKRNFDQVNEAPSYYMWRIMDQGREPLRRNLARIAGCDSEEIAIQRNASEALETIIFGLSLKAGDEVVLSKQDYPNMINAWKQREQRDGIKLVWVDLPLPSENNDQLVKLYTQAFTPNTRVVHLTHVINWNGQIMPVRKIADAAYLRHIEVVVDGAHSFAHFQFKVTDLGADYFGSSLHKWLSACIGVGVLYVKKEKIKNLYPLFAAPDARADDIRKFENLGTRPFFIEQAVGKAIEFYEMIGAERKEQRLFYLKNYWMNKVKDIPGIEFGTSMKPGFGCGIGLVNYNAPGFTPADLDVFLWNKYRIHTTNVNWELIRGVRITPNVYTTTGQLDILAEGINDFVTNWKKKAK